MVSILCKRFLLVTPLSFLQVSVCKTFLYGFHMYHQSQSESSDFLVSATLELHVGLTANLKVDIIKRERLRFFF
jgi:hypothetical protein